MNANGNGMVRVKGYVSRETADAIRRGEVRSNNGLRRTSGRGSWYPEQPEFELDDGPTIEELREQAYREECFNFVMCDVIPLARYLFRTEAAPRIKLWLQERRKRKEREAQIAEAKYVAVEADVNCEDDSEPENPGPGNVIDFSEHAKAICQ